MSLPYTVLGGCIDVENVSALQFVRVAAYIAQLLQGMHFSEQPGSRFIINLKAEVRDKVYSATYPKEYAVAENDESNAHSSKYDEE